MKMKKLIFSLSAAITTGFIVGLIMSIYHIIVKRYIQYGMLRLAAFDLQKWSNKLIALSLIISLFLSFIARPLWKLSLSNLPKMRNIFRHWKLSYKHMTRSGLVSISLALILNLGITIDGRINSARGANIILIVIDCLRPDHLSCHGYGRNTSPNIDSLAQGGVIFKNAYSNAPWTKPSVAAIFTSLYPNAYEVINDNDVLPEQVLTIAEILKNSGYYTCFFNGGNSFIDRQFNFDQGFDFYELMEPPDANLLTDSFLSQISRINGKRFFAYIHYMDVHLPYYRNKYTHIYTKNTDSHLEPDKILVEKVRKLTSAGKLSEDEKEYLVAVYDGQIKFVDESVKKITDALKDEDIHKDTVIVLTSDHGEEFWQHNNYEHGHTLYNELIHVPLIIAGSELTCSETRICVRLVDLVPTIIEITGAKAGRFSTHGVDISSLTGKNKKPELPVFAMGTFYADEKYCLIKGNKKLIFNTGEKKNKRELTGWRSSSMLELYDLAADPRERNNRMKNGSETGSGLLEDLYRFKDTKSMFKSKQTALDQELKERLKSLGYL